MNPDPQSQPRHSQAVIDRRIESFFQAYGVEETTEQAEPVADPVQSIDVAVDKGRAVSRGGLFRVLRVIKRVAVKALMSVPPLHGLYLRIFHRSLFEAGSQQVALGKKEVRSLFDQALEDFLDRGERLDFPATEAPELSVVVVVYNQAGLLLQTLTYLQRSSASIELVLVDNASDARTREVISRVDGARVIQNDDNLGFLRAANQGALASTGRYLLFLNSDCLVFPSAITRSIEFARENPGAGALGARIINFNGLLQEAGSEVLSDGSCRGIGRGEDPLADRYMHVRSVDFCSGAFLLTPRRLFLDCGLFDEDYAPAYYEEVDYCVRALQRGYDVVYLPSVAVLHYEFGSEQKRGDAIKLQIQNRGVFQRKHKAFLEDKKQAGSRPTRLSVLVVDDRVPHASSGAGSPRCRAIIEALTGTGADVTFFATSMITETWGSIYRTLPPRVRVVRPAGMMALPAFLREDGPDFDLIVISRPHNMEVAARPLAELKSRASERGEPAPFVIYDAEAVFSDRELLRAELLESASLKRRALSAREKEFGLIRAGDLVWAVSDKDAERIEERSGVRTLHVGHQLIPRRSNTRFDERKDFLFVGFLGNDGSPNVDSLLWFMAKVWPRIQDELGDAVRVLVAGDCSAASLSTIQSDCIRFLGPQDSLESLYDRCRVFIAPTRFAAGIPHKVHEAAANGIPTVATELLCNQLGWRDQEELLSAGDDEEFAEKCIQLYREEALWERIREGGLAAVARDCSSERFRASILESIALAGPDART
jgi:GT2 family glycosyltransferase